MKALNAAVSTAVSSPQPVQLRTHPPPLVGPIAGHEARRRRAFRLDLGLGLARQALMARVGPAAASAETGMGGGPGFIENLLWYLHRP